MKIVTINDKNYELIKEYKDGFDLTATEEKLTDYFDDFDYICGDWAYGKLRLKGFYDSKNKKVSKINNYKDLDKYLKNNCAPDCKYFVIKSN